MHTSDAVALSSGARPGAPLRSMLDAEFDRQGEGAAPGFSRNAVLVASMCEIRGFHDVCGFLRRNAG
jgi:hypothetical protein